VLPDGQECKGPLLFWFDSSKKFCYLPAHAYEANKDSLPDVCFATHAPIDDIASKPFPSLSGVEIDESADPEPRYYYDGFITPDAKEQFIVKEKDFWSASSEKFWPLVYMRTRKAIKKIDSVPRLNVQDFQPVDPEFKISFQLCPQIGNQEDETI